MGQTNLDNLFKRLHVYFLIGPCFLRLIFPETFEIKLTFQILGYSLFLPELVYFLLPLVSLKNKSLTKFNRKLLSLSVLGVIFGFFSSVNGNSDLVINNFLAGTDFYITIIVFSLFPLQQDQIKHVLLPTFLLWLIISLEIVLYSFGILSYSKELGNSFDYGGISRISTTIASSTGTAVAYFMITLILFQIIEKKYKNKILFAGFGVVLITLTRSGVLAYTIILFLWYQQKSNTKLRVGFYFKVAFFGALFFFVIDSVGLLDGFKARDEALKYGQRDFSNGRFARWNRGYEYIKEYPLLGSGANFITKHKRANLAKVDSLNAFSPHNTYILILMERGALGLLLFVLILLTIYREMKSSPRSILRAGLSISIILLMNFEVVFVYMEFTGLFILSLYIVVIPKNNIKHQFIK